VLALALIFNGAVVPPVVAHTAMAAGHDTAAHAMPAHCHHQDASMSSAAVKHRQNKYLCCIGDGACQCGCVVTFALLMTFPDLRPLAPLTLTDQLYVSAPVATPRHRLLRPPIV